MQSQRGVRVFGHRFHCKAANLLQCTTSQHGTRTAKKSGIPQIISILNQAVEQGVLVGLLAKMVQVALERIRREKMVRRLHQRQTRVLSEFASSLDKERTRWHVITGKNGHQVTITNP